MRNTRALWVIGLFAPGCLTTVDDGVPGAGESLQASGGVAQTEQADPPGPETSANLPPPTAEGSRRGACDQAGLPLDGLMYSPGGELLPFPCEPFHPTDNNPYAVRCVDAWPWYSSGFVGDEHCILPPEPGQGIQLGVHPQGQGWYEQVARGDLSGYSPGALPDGFLLPPGVQEEHNYRTRSGNDAPRAFYRAYLRTRAGAHHMLVSAVESDAAEPREGWVEDTGPPSGLASGYILMAQRAAESHPMSHQQPPADEGLYTELAAAQPINFNMNLFNSGEASALKEVWVNLWWEASATTPQELFVGMPLSQAAETFAQPGDSVDMHYAFAIDRPTRVIHLLGHRHVWTSNFTAWVEKPGGQHAVLYQSFDWSDPPTYRYDGVTENPMPSRQKRSDGGASGVHVLQPGEELHFNCHMAFTPERAATERAPMPSAIGPLRFSNQVHHGEMCVLLGAADVPLGQPARDPAPVPDFAR